jgi:hypothetical protein
MEFIKAGGSYAIVLVKKQTFASKIGMYSCIAPSKRFLSKDKDLLQLRKYSIKMQLGLL